MSKKKTSIFLPIVGIGIAVLFISKKVQAVKQPTVLMIDKRPRPNNA